VDRGAAVQANRTLSVLRAWLNWCVERGILPVSPATGVKPPTTETSRDRVLSADELHEIWTTSEAIGYPNGGFLRFLILTAQRRGEVATMRWQDVDLDKEVWTLPKESTKAGRVHDVPLSTAALDILKALPRFKYVGDDGKEHDGEFVWTSTSGRKPINGFSKLKARVDKETLKRRKAEAEKAGRDTGQIKNLAEWTLHDVRRTAATGMAKAGVPPHVLSALLNHTPGSAMGVTSIYNRFRYTEERRAALQAWAEFVLRLEAKKEEGAA
jgi:integrase